MTWLSHSWGLIFERLLQHLTIALPAIVLAVAIAVPLGYLSHHAQTRGNRLAGPLTSAVGAIYAIPSLPLLIAIPAFTGLPLRSSATAIVALTLYGVALLVTGSADAFASVAPPTHSPPSPQPRRRRRRRWAFRGCAAHSRLNCPSQALFFSPIFVW